MGMDVHTARQQVLELAADLQKQRETLDEAEWTVAELTNSVRGTEKLLSAFIDVFPALDETLTDMGIDLPARPATDQAPRGSEAVRQVMHERPGRHWLVSELVESLRENGWLPVSDNPANAVRTTLERLAGASETTDIYKDKLQRDGVWKVAYCFDPDRTAPPEPELPGGAYPYEEEPF